MGSSRHGRRKNLPKYFSIGRQTFEGDNSAFHTTVENLPVVNVCGTVCIRKRKLVEICGQHTIVRLDFLFNFISILILCLHLLLLLVCTYISSFSFSCWLWHVIMRRETLGESSERSRLPYFVSLYFIFVSRDSLSPPTTTTTTLFLLSRSSAHSKS